MKNAPWQVNTDPNYEGGRPGIIWGKDGPGHGAICHLSPFWSNRSPRDFNEDHARLIASAPDLLEACKKALTCASIDSNVAALLRAAIAKATGGGGA
jgi:hypothetical protein